MNELEQLKPLAGAPKLCEIEVDLKDQGRVKPVGKMNGHTWWELVVNKPEDLKALAQQISGRDLSDCDDARMLVAQGLSRLRLTFGSPIGIVVRQSDQTRMVIVLGERPKEAVIEDYVTLAKFTLSFSREKDIIVEEYVVEPLVEDKTILLWHLKELGPSFWTSDESRGDERTY